MGARGLRGRGAHVAVRMIGPDLVRTAMTAATLQLAGLLGDRLAAGSR